MDRQTRFQSDSIAAALLVGDVLVRGAAAFDLHASLSLAAPAAAAGDLDLSETQAAGAPARPANGEISKPKIKSVRTEGRSGPITNNQRPTSNAEHPTRCQAMPHWMFDVRCSVFDVFRC